jgi:hypothetical protein
LLLALCLLIVRTPTANEWMPAQKPYCSKTKSNPITNAEYSFSTGNLSIAHPLQTIESKIKVKFVAHLSSSKSALSRDHLNHAFHHKLTSKTPQRNSPFS